MPRLPKKPAASPPAKLPGPGTFHIPVVGGSHYQEALETICGGRTEFGVRLQTTALLVPDDQNPHDSQAVRVEIDGQTVGFLTRYLAGRYRKALEQAGQPMLVASCDAVIVGGWDRGAHDRGHFGVRLDLPPT